MAPSIPTSAPRLLVAGTTWKWAPAYPNYAAADGWTLTYYLVGATTIEFAATVADGAFVVSVPRTKTEIPPGTYSLLGYAALADERFECFRGTVTVLDSGLNAPQDQDRRAWCEKTLRVLEDVLSGKVSSDLAEYNIAGKSVKSHSLTELFVLRAALRQELYTKRTGRKRQVERVRFGRA